MSNTKREPLLSDKALGDLRRMVISDAEMDSPARSKGPWLMGFVFGSEKVRTIYEAARAKDAELIQMAVDACTDPHKMSLSSAFLAAAEAAGFKPSDR